MATDFIEISANEFYASRHDSVDRVRPDLRNKYDDLYAKYACFTQNIALPPTAASASSAYPPPRKGSHQNSHHMHGKNHNRGHHHGHSGHHHHAGGYNSVNPNRKPRDIHKTIMGIFNVLNKSNYGKLLTKVRLIKTESNIGVIMAGLLDTCVLQIFYLEIYMQFLTNIVENSCESERIIIMKKIGECIEGFIKERSWCQLETETETNTSHAENKSSYIVFCEKQKLKSKIVAKNMMVIELMHMFPDLNTELNPKSHVESLRSDLLNALKNEETEQSVLVLHMLTYIMKTGRVENTCIDMIAFLPGDAMNKIRFMVEDLGKL